MTTGKHEMQRHRKAAAAALAILAMAAPALAPAALAPAALAQDEVIARRTPPPGAETAEPPPLPGPVKPGYAPFPARNPDAVADWIVGNLTVQGLTLITSGPSLSVWILPDRIDRSAAPRVSFWERNEITATEAERQLGGRSLMIQKDIDCQRKIVRVRYTTIYKANNLKDYDRGLAGDGGAQLISPEMHETLEMAKVC